MGDRTREQSPLLDLIAEAFEMGQRAPGPHPGEDFNAWVRRVEQEPPPPELLAKAQKAVEAQQRHRAWLATLTPEEQEVERQKELDCMLDFILHGPGGD